jgi:hypothetical protein
MVVRAVFVFSDVETFQLWQQHVGQYISTGLVTMRGEHGYKMCEDASVGVVNL